MRPVTLCLSMATTPPKIFHYRNRLTDLQQVSQTNTAVPHCQEGKIKYPNSLPRVKTFRNTCATSPSQLQETMTAGLHQPGIFPGKSVYPTGAKNYSSPLLPQHLQPFPGLLQDKATFGVTTKVSLPTPSSASPPHQSVVTKLTNLQLLR